MAGVDEVHALAEAILEAARVARLGLSVAYDDGVVPRHIYVNEAAAEVLGYSVEELIGNATAITFAPEERERMALLSSQWRRGEILPSLEETVALRKDGERVPIEIARVVVLLSGEPAIVTFLRDIRERKAVEAERKRMQAQLALADRMATLGMLAAGVAHEINNPLAYVALNVETLVRTLQRLDADGTENTSAAIAAARDGLARVASIVRDLRGFSTPTTEERWPVDVESVLESAINVAMHAIRGRVRLVRRFAEAPSLKTDPARLGQIVLNLLFNAVQSFDSGDETTNRVTLTIASPHAEEVAVGVADNGPGIAGDDLARIFEPFYTTKTTGTGLGLAICQTLTTSLGGKLDVESDLGRGTKFTVRLPVRMR